MVSSKVVPDLMSKCLGSYLNVGSELGYSRSIYAFCYEKNMLSMLHVMLMFRFVSNLLDYKLNRCTQSLVLCLREI